MTISLISCSPSEKYSVGSHLPGLMRIKILSNVSVNVTNKLPTLPMNITAPRIEHSLSVNTSFGFKLMMALGRNQLHTNAVSKSIITVKKEEKHDSPETSTEYHNFSFNGIRL